MTLLTSPYVAQVRAQLNDLPPTFKRDQDLYRQIIDMESMPLGRHVGALYGIMAQLNFQNAKYSWIDIWGLLFNVPRQTGEADSIYRTRISQTLLAWVGTIPGLIVWTGFRLGVAATVEEWSPGPGYSITIPSSLTAQQINNYLEGLNRIRPAGVPFRLYLQTSGLYVGTIEFLGDHKVTGAYLSAGTTAYALSISSSTVNAQPVLPRFYFVDPTLNPPGA